MPLHNCFLILNLSPLNVENGVPEFWLNAMKNNEVLAEEVITC